MLSEKSEQHILSRVVAVPFYDNFPMQRPPEEPRQILYYSKEFATNGELAVIYKDDALHPRYKSGALLFLKQWDNDKS